MKTVAQKEAKQFARVPCDCKGGAYVDHYDLVRCHCGHTWWALRPERSGPLVLFRWPGNWRSGDLTQRREGAKGTSVPAA
jgi:hypothetical protein